MHALSYQHLQDLLADPLITFLRSLKTFCTRRPALRLNLLGWPVLYKLAVVWNLQWNYVFQIIWILFLNPLPDSQASTTFFSEGLSSLDHSMMISHMIIPWREHQTLDMRGLNKTQALSLEHLNLILWIWSCDKWKFWYNIQILIIHMQ